MAIPLLQTYRVAKYLAGRKLRGDKRYPLVLMLEPLFQCNLACAGCGKIDYPKEILQKRMSVEDALQAVDECGAPMVSIPGGEPLIHKEMPQIVAGIVARKKFVYLCTNAILLAKHIDEYQPSPYLTFSIHLDGNCSAMTSRYARKACSTRRSRRSGCAREQGISRHHQLHAVQRRGSGRSRGVLRYRDELGIEGITVSPGYSYQHAPRQDVFLGRSASKQLFREIFRRAAAGGHRAGRSTTRRCSWIFSRATRPISARPGAIRPTTCSAGSGPATCCRTRAMRRASAR